MNRERIKSSNQRIIDYIFNIGRDFRYYQKLKTKRQVKRMQ
jgi:hypothetical protein